MSNDAVYCGAFSLGTKPKSSQDIIKQNFFGYSLIKVAVIVVSGLVPSTKYNFYCTAISNSGIQMTIQNIMRIVISAATSCCKSLYLSILKNSMTTQGSFLNAIMISLDYSPTLSMKVKTYFISVDSEGVVPLAYPETITLSNRTSGSNYITVLTSDPGQYNIRLILSGSSSSEYKIVYPLINVITVLSNSQPPPAPLLKSITYSDDATYIIVKFDSDTNKGSLNNIFTCNAIFDFSGSSVSTCQWIDFSTINIFPSPKFPFPSSISLLSSNKIKAQCTVSFTTVQCNSWSSILPLDSIIISVSANALIPTIVISAPSKIIRCSSLTIDLTNSIGAARRPWLSVKFDISIQGVTDTSSNLYLFLNSNNFTLSPPTTIPNTLLTAGNTYNMKIRLCNFLKLCGEKLYSIQVVDSEQLTPVVSILGDSVKTIKRSDSLVISSNSFIESCASKIYSNFAYKWIIKDFTNGYLLQNISSSAQNPSSFILKPYTLRSNVVYQITLQVTYTPSSVSSLTTLFVDVLQGNIYAVIADGSIKQVQVMKNFTIDASKSYDEDAEIKSLSFKYLSYVWSCIQIQPVFSSDCSLIFISTGPILLASSTSSAANGVFRVTVTVSNSGQRTSSAYIDISIAINKVSQLSISLSDSQSQQNVNTNQKVLFIGSLSLVETCTAVWSVDDTQLNLNSVSLTPTSVNLVSGSTNTLPFVLSVGSLPQRTTLVFSLECGNSKTSITITTNGSPLPGNFDVMPIKGIELSTNFRFSASYWSDPDLPLSYQFGFISESSLVNLVILSVSELSFDTTILPAGSSSSQYVVNCTLQVIDSYHAATNTFTDVIVKPIDLSQQKLLINKLISSQSGTIDQSKKTIAAGSSILNNVNCTSAINCKNIGREKCMKTPNTCGGCLVGYIGDIGDHNSPCILPESHSVDYSNGTCFKDSDCPSAWWKCMSHKCILKEKVCPDSCSGKGSCSFSNSFTGDIVDTCLVNDFSCEATCHCVDQFSGVSCEISLNNLIFRQSTRSKLINMLFNITKSDNINSQSIVAWADSLSTLSQNPYEVRIRDADISQNIANTIVSNAQSMNYQSWDSLIGVLQSLNAIYSVTIFNYISSLNYVNGSSFGNRTFNSHFNNASATKILNTLNQFSDLISNSMVEGQNRSSLVYSNFRMSNEVIKAIPDSQITVESPLTDIEKLSLGANNISKVAITLNSDVVLSSSLKISLIITSAKATVLKGLKLLSNPLHVKVSDTTTLNNAPNTANFISETKFYLQNNGKPNLGKGIIRNFTTNCRGLNDYQSYNYTCENSHNIVHTCNGTKATLVSYCPHPIISCQMLNDTIAGQSTFTNCTVGKVTDTSVLCICSKSHSGGRKLGDGSGQDILNVVSAVSSSSIDIFTTFESARSISISELFSKSYIVIAMYGTLWSVFFIGLLLFWFLKINRGSNNTVLPVSNNVSRRNAIPITSFLSSSVRPKMIDYVNSIMPLVFQFEKSPLQRLKEELLLHHNFFVLFSSTKVSVGKRIVSWLRLFTIQSLLMFLLAVLYDIQNPSDDGSCVTFFSESECIKRKLILDTSQSYCEWNSADNNNTTSNCTYQQPTLTMGFIFFSLILVFIVTEVLSIPVDILLDALRLPLKSSGGESEVKFSSEGIIEESVIPTDVEVVSISKKETDSGHLNLFSLESTNARHRDLVRILIHTVKEKYHLLKSNKNRYFRKLISHLSFDSNHADFLMSRYCRPTDIIFLINNSVSIACSDLMKLILLQHHIYMRLEINTLVEKYENQWNIQIINNPEIYNKEEENIDSILKYQISDNTRDLLIKQLTYVGKTVNQLSDKYKTSDNLCGVDLFYRFILDLMGQNADKKIFQNKLESDFEEERKTIIIMKILAVIIILGSNLFFCGYSVLKGYSKGLDWQTQYLNLCIFQFLTEVFVFSSVECILLHYTLPSLAADAVQKVQNVIIHLIDNLCGDEINKLEDPYSKLSVFNASIYLFVSTRLSLLFPNLLESYIVSSYYTNQPGVLLDTLVQDIREEKKIIENKKYGSSLKRSFSFLFSLIKKIATIPLAFQRLLVRVIQPIILTGVTTIFYYININAIYSATIFALLIILTFIVWYIIIRFKKKSRTIIDINPEVDFEYIFADDIYSLSDDSDEDQSDEINIAFYSKSEENSNESESNNTSSDDSDDNKYKTRDNSSNTRSQSDEESVIDNDNDNNNNNNNNNNNSESESNIAGVDQSDNSNNSDNHSHYNHNSDNISDNNNNSSHNNDKYESSEERSSERSRTESSLNDQNSSRNYSDEDSPIEDSQSEYESEDVKHSKCSSRTKSYLSSDDESRINNNNNNNNNCYYSENESSKKLISDNRSDSRSSEDS